MGTGGAAAGHERLERRLPWGIALVARALYVATLALDVEWGDAGKFQWMAWRPHLRFEETGHPLRALLAHPLVRWSGLQPARAANLSSALISALALVPAFRVARLLGASRAAGGLRRGVFPVRRGAAGYLPRGPGPRGAARGRPRASRARSRDATRIAGSSIPASGET